MNDFVTDADDEDAPRQGAGDQVVDSSTKWHKHTIAVFDILKKNMDVDNGGTEMLSFEQLVKGSVSRRTAAGVFFELLQLKTWDFVELDQDEPYTDILVRILTGSKLVATKRECWSNSIFSQIYRSLLVSSSPKKHQRIRLPFLQAESFPTLAAFSLTCSYTRLHQKLSDSFFGQYTRCNTGNLFRLTLSIMVCR